ncbi:hypothetical protein NC00_18770 [Xanthomonas cannabis pv. phaseoli]|uniref:Caspase family p20 domain-containing protein n=1 Tax=Xanthomonas cannabis pv. phaseoli TaxID=1885902 RepID=A0AB34P3U0_9XANT|nr:hypothetical protein NC00_18770 [Xanthomonas cannabis pv. phaseoli]
MPVSLLFDLIFGDGVDPNGKDKITLNHHFKSCVRENQSLHRKPRLEKLLNPRRNELKIDDFTALFIGHGC